MELVDHVNQLHAMVQNQQQQLAQVMGQQQAQAQTLVHTHTLRPTKPDHFHGHAKADATLWLWSMEQFQTASRMADADKVIYATTYLREAAASWWKSESTRSVIRTVVIDGSETVIDLNTWAGFKSLFLSRFRPLDASRAARANLMQLKQTGSVQDYTNRFLKELQLIDGMDTESQLAMYTRGLKHHVAIEIEKANMTDLSQAMNLAARIDMLTYRSNRTQTGPNRGWNGSRGWSQPTSNSSYGSVPMELGALLNDSESNQDGSVTVSRDTLNALFSRMNRGGRQNRGNGYRVPGLSKDEYQRLSREGKCFRCKQPGHMARDCPSTPSHQHSALSMLPPTQPSN